MHTGASDFGPRRLGLCLLHPPHQALAGAGPQSTSNDERYTEGKHLLWTYLKTSLTCTQFWVHFYLTDFLWLENLILQLGGTPLDEIPAGGWGRVE